MIPYDMQSEMSKKLSGSVRDIRNSNKKLEPLIESHKDLPSHFFIERNGEVNFAILVFDDEECEDVYKIYDPVNLSAAPFLMQAKYIVKAINVRNIRLLKVDISIIDHLE